MYGSISPGQYMSAGPASYMDFFEPGAARCTLTGTSRLQRAAPFAGATTTFERNKARASALLVVVVTRCVVVVTRCVVASPS